MTKADLFARIDRIEGPDHHQRNELLVRNGTWRTCADCPREDDGSVYPERCKHAQRVDHTIPVHNVTVALLRRYHAENHLYGRSAEWKVR